MSTENEILIDKLRSMVENTIGREVHTPRDFTFLHNQITELTHQSLSMSTLKRVWGYTSREFNISRYTLDVLSKLVGYTGWEKFCESIDIKENSSKIEASSHSVVIRRLAARALNQGDIVRLHWQPNRCLEIVYEGLDLFSVIKSENSKLMVGDKFQTMMFIDHQPLFLYCVQRDGFPPFDYRCGNNGGILWNLVNPEEE